MNLAAITGLEAEARIARGAGFKAMASGGIEANTLSAADYCLRAGADALLSFGIAGALASHLQPGALLLPRGVCEEDGTRYAVDEAWHARVAQMFAGAGLAIETGDMLGAAAAAATTAEKAALARRSGAVAIDLESHLVARTAARAGQPFLILRAISDTAMQALPPAAVNGLGADGKPALGRVLMSVARDPRQIPALIHLAGGTRRALAALTRALSVSRFA
jgi:hopanoid-associated phosphorylase